MRSPHATHSHAPRRLAFAAALAATYFVWGTTFVATRFALEAVGPYELVALRCALGCATLLAWRGLVDAHPARFAPPRAWRWLVISGLLLFAGGHGLGAWAQVNVPSSAAAVAFATIPIWLTVGAAALDRVFPSTAETVGLACGVAGVVAIALLRDGRGAFIMAPLDLARLLIASIAWVGGSLVTQRRLGDLAPLDRTIGQLAVGTLACLLVSMLLGETQAQRPPVPVRALVAVLYLGVFSSALTFSAYVWLLGHTTTARAGSYALVNPVIALAAGALLAGETVSTPLILACALVIGGVGAVFAGACTKQLKRG